MATDLSYFGSAAIDSGDVAVTATWTSIGGIHKLGGTKTGIHLNLNNDGAAALTNFKITKSATVGGHHQDWMVDTDFNTGTLECTSVVDGTSPPNIHLLANGSQGQIKLDRQNGVAEIQFWAKSVGTNLHITGTAA